jgi:hypothetical protein
MAYGTYDKKVHIFQDASDGIDDVHVLEVGAADLGAPFDVVEPITVTRIGVIATVAYAYDTQTVEANVSVDRRIAYGSDTGRVEIGVIKQLDATPAGTVIKLDINPVDLDVGDQVVLEAKVAGTGGGSIAGDWKGFFCYHPRAEVMANQSEQTDTA